MIRRYTIYNFYVRGSNQAPQACHALSNLYKSYSQMTEVAKNLFDDWSFNHETEIMLQGGDNTYLEELYTKLQNIKDIPSAKFNESEKALKGVCTVVTFVANKKIAIANEYVRKNGLIQSQVVEDLKKIDFKSLGLDESLTEEEIFVVSVIAFLSSAN